MKKTQRKNSYFISLEGGDASGKTTLAASLSKAFEQKAFPFLLTREPGGIPFAEKIRSLLLEEGKDLDARAELFLFLAARAQHCQKLILPHLSKGGVLLCDRFYDSTLAYQGLGRSLGVEKVEELSLYSSFSLIPDRTFYLDLSFEKSQERLALMKKKKDYLEEEGRDFHEKVRSFFQSRSSLDRFIVLDAELSPEALFQKAWAQIQRDLEVLYD